MSPTAMTLLELQHLCRDSGVEYIGNRDDMNVLLASALIFILPSYYPEGVPKVLLEAAGAGVPVITTDHPGCRDAVINKVTGILVEPKDPLVISKAISFLLKNSEMRIKMGIAGRKHAELEFDQIGVVNEHYRIYYDNLN